MSILDIAIGVWLGILIYKVHLLLSIWLVTTWQVIRFRHQLDRHGEPA